MANLLAMQGSNDATCCQEVGSINDAWWRELGMCAIETGNPSSWKSGCSKMLEKSDADVVVLQEARISDQEL